MLLTKLLATDSSISITEESPPMHALSKAVCFICSDLVIIHNMDIVVHYFQWNNLLLQEETVSQE